jgi:hypothetical protein
MERAVHITTRTDYSPGGRRTRIGVDIIGYFLLIAAYFWLGSRGLELRFEPEHLMRNSKW